MKNMRAKLAAAILAGAMAVSSMGVTAMAEDKVPAKELKITKTITKEDTTYAPVETFTFKVESGAANNNFNGETVYAGVENGLTAGDIAFDGTKTEATGESTLTVDSSKFTKPGVYHYVLSENKGSNNMMTYDEKQYDIYVYVYADGTAPEVVAVEKGAENADNKVGSLDFSNDYDKETDRTHDVTVTKTITGNQSVPTNTYNFEYKVTSTSDNELTYTAEVNGKKVEGGIVKGQTYTATLTNNGTIKIYGLTENDTVEIYEVDKDANQDGYTTTVKDADGVTANDKGTGVSGEVTKDGAKATVDNNKNTSTPTGIVMTYAPYILIAALACAFAAVFLRRRNREEI
ncbi:MAG: FctA domain-containing protein [Lachnospiraceae bacterium]|nr:FctA domain-containing protein [Lachnospiraceae bacterium]